MRIPRFLHRLWAILAGYYWIPCPICGEYIGGHEFSPTRSGFLKHSPLQGNITCHKCRPEAKRRNRINGFLIEEAPECLNPKQ